ncbi:MAG: asparagine synthase (glutamine-hydrolyzing) [Planctomycetota bacterium]
MCGLVGAFPIPGRSFRSEDVKPAMDRMNRRGPDAEGVWQDAGVVLGHRRLSILDPDPRSHQPMVSACGRHAIVFNGEIYNFRELRRDLEEMGTAFRTTSDTEVLLAMFAAEGEAMLSRLRGMFAFVIWDRIAKRGFAARDAYGIKPLYYAQTPEGALLASQVKALLDSGKVSAAPDARGQAGFWLLGNVPEPRTWYRDIVHLPAGYFAWIENGRVETPRQWWDIGAAWREAPGPKRANAEVCESVRQSVLASVKAHLVSDVPVGVFLSGGIDSGALAGLIQDACAGSIKGVTIAFREFAGRDEDEAPAAALVAKHLGLEHHVRVITRGEFDADLPRILEAIDQPSIDGINTWYAAKAAAELGLKVVVSGIGGDELFQGYSTFRKLPRLVSTWRKLSLVPGAMSVARAAAGLKARRSGNRRWSQLPEGARTIAGAWWLSRGLFSPEELTALMGDDLAHQALRDFSPGRWVEEMSGPLPDDLRLALGQIESTTYLRNQLLRDSDWASMAHGVELRTPLVDTWLLRELQPLLASFGRFPGKSLLAGSPSRGLPVEVLKRPKTGFGIPLGRWLGGDAVTRSPGSDSREWSRRVVRDSLSGLSGRRNPEA